MDLCTKYSCKILIADGEPPMVIGLAAVNEIEALEQAAIVVGLHADCELIELYDGDRLICTVLDKRQGAAQPGTAPR